MLKSHQQVAEHTVACGGWLQNPAAFAAALLAAVLMPSLPVVVAIENDQVDAEGRPRLSFLRCGSSDNGSLSSHGSSVSNFSRFFMTEAQQPNPLNVST